MFALTPFNSKLPKLRDDGFADFYNMMDGFFNDSLFGGLRNDSFRMDIRENDTEYIIEAELPGAKKEEIKIDLNNNQLSISVTREERKDDEKENYIHRERRYSAMQRSVYLRNIADEGIKARFDNGVLEISVPKKDKSIRSAQIEIE